MRRGGALVFLVPLLVFTAAACGQPPAGPTADYQLYEAASTNGVRQVAVIDSRSHVVSRNLPLGTASPDWAHLYTIDANTLLDLDPQTGAVAMALQLPGHFQLPPATLSGLPGGLSQNGQWLVVQALDGAANSLPSATHMLVIDTASSKIVNRLDLTGDFQFDAVSNDGMRLYLIQYLSSTEYNVRLYDLTAHSLDANIVVDKADGNQAMAGLRLSGVASPDGHWLYSIYVRQNQSPFIHALSMDGPFAFCIDLPGSGYLSAGGASEFHWSLAMSRDGSRLFAVNGAIGLVADVIPATNYQPGVKRIVHIDTAGPAKPPAQGVVANQSSGDGAVISPDGGTLVVTAVTGMVWLDTTNLQTRSRALGDWRIAGLRTSPDGKTLYALRDSGSIAEISMSSQTVDASFDPRTGQPMALMRVVAPA